MTVAHRFEKKLDRNRSLQDLFIRLFRGRKAPVDVEFAKNLSENLTIRLSPQVRKQLRRQADQVGVGPSTLARRWIVEHPIKAGKRRSHMRV